MEKRKTEKTVFTNYVVGSTTDYDQFKIVASNRTIKKSNVANLMKSFKITKGMSKSHPIIVDRNLNVVDGQHRLEACKKMGIPVHYLITDDAIETIPVFNAYQEKWGLEDYARYFAQNGNKNYERILQVKDRVGIGINAILESLGIPTGKNVNSSFKEGRFVFDIDIFVSKNDYKEHHNELYQQFKADAYSFGINTDLRDMVIDKLSNEHTKLVVSKIRNKGEE